MQPCGIDLDPADVSMAQEPGAGAERPEVRVLGVFDSGVGNQDQLGPTGTAESTLHCKVGLDRTATGQRVIVDTKLHHPGHNAGDSAAVPEYRDGLRLAFIHHGPLTVAAVPRPRAQPREGCQTSQGAGLERTRVRAGEKLAMIS